MKLTCNERKEKQEQQPVAVAQPETRISFLLARCRGAVRVGIVVWGPAADAAC